MVSPISISSGRSPRSANAGEVQFSTQRFFGMITESFNGGIGYVTPHETKEMFHEALIPREKAV
jgi:hypothetical protein